MKTPLKKMKETILIQKIILLKHPKNKLMAKIKKAKIRMISQLNKLIQNASNKI